MIFPGIVLTITPTSLLGFAENLFVCFVVWCACCACACVLCLRVQYDRFGEEAVRGNDARQGHDVEGFDGDSQPFGSQGEFDDAAGGKWGFPFEGWGPFTANERMGRPLHEVPPVIRRCAQADKGQRDSLLESLVVTSGRLGACVRAHARLCVCCVSSRS